MYIDMVLCIIPASRLDKATMPIDVFELMKKATLIDTNNVDFLLECLCRIHRFDLVLKLGFDVDAVREALPTFKKISLYRFVEWLRLENFISSKSII